jgi:hypothetical protein
VYAYVFEKKSQSVKRLSLLSKTKIHFIINQTKINQLPYIKFLKSTLLHNHKITFLKCLNECPLSTSPYMS